MPETTPLLSPEARVHRLQHIFARMEEGAPYATIGAEEGISAARVCQIVGAALKERPKRRGPVHSQMQMTRLMPALSLARREVAAGSLAAIRPMQAVLNRLDLCSRQRTDHSTPVIDVGPDAGRPSDQALLDWLDGLVPPAQMDGGGLAALLDGQVGPPIAPPQKSGRLMTDKALKTQEMALRGS